MKNLPIPYDFNGRRLAAFDVHAPRTKTIGDARAKAIKGDVYGAMVEFAKGSIISLADIDGEALVTDRPAIEKALMPMPYRDIETIVIEAILAAGVEDSIEGVYHCPRCDHQIITEFDPDDEYAERISRLPVICSKDGAPFTITLTSPVKIEAADRDELINQIDTVTIRYPTVDDVLRAARAVGTENSMALQMRIYAQATLAINGQEVDQKWRGEWGQFVYDRIDVADARAIGQEVQKYGRATSVERVCPNCGKHWKAEVNTGRFFTSGLSE